MAGKRKVWGLCLGAIGLGILLARIMPLVILVALEGLCLLIIGWLLLRNG